MIALPPALYAVASVLALQSPAQVAPEERLVLVVATAAVAFEAETGMPVVDIQLDPASSQAFAGFTASNVGKRMVLRANGEILVTPYIAGPIPDGRLSINPGGGDGAMTVKDMYAFVKRLKSHRTKIEVNLLPPE